MGQKRTVRVRTARFDGEEQHICLYSLRDVAWSIILLFPLVLLSRDLLISQFSNLCSCFPFQASHSFSIFYPFLSHSKFHFLLWFLWLPTISDYLENIPFHKLPEVWSKVPFPQAIKDLTWPQKFLGILSHPQGHSTEADCTPFA